DLVNLANNCLVKAPEIRLRIVSWGDFDPVLTVSDATAAAKVSIKKRRVRALYESASVESYSSQQEERRRKQVLGEILSRISEQTRAASDESDLPPRIIKEIPADEGDCSLLIV